MNLRKVQNLSLADAGTLKLLVCASVCSALTCILAWFAIPIGIGPVPISLATVAVYFSGALLGPNYGALSQIIYIILLCCGLPVAGGFSGGFGVVVGPTGGYILGYVTMAFLTGAIYNCLNKRINCNSSKNFFKQAVSLVIAGVVATLSCYLLGTIWLMYSTKINLLAALTSGVLPFIIGDFLKICLVASVVPKIEKFVV